MSDQSIALHSTKSERNLLIVTPDKAVSFSNQGFFGPESLRNVDMISKSANGAMAQQQLYYSLIP